MKEGEVLFSSESRDSRLLIMISAFTNQLIYFYFTKRITRCHTTPEESIFFWLAMTDLVRRKRIFLEPQVSISIPILASHL